MLQARIKLRLREDGVVATVRSAFVHVWRKVHPAGVDDFDLRHGTDTSGTQPLWELRIDSPNLRFGVRYQPTAEGELEQLVGFLSLEVGRFTFVDLGCGKGRALLMAASLGFREAIGVEFAADLAATAVANLVTVGVTNVTVIHGDAAEFAFPPGDLVVYLYNPFGAEIMEKVLANLSRRIVRQVAGDIYIAYKKITCAGLLDQSPFLRRIGAAPGSTDMVIWKVVAQSTAPAGPAL